MNILIIEDDVNVLRTTVDWLKASFADLDVSVSIKEAYNSAIAVQVISADTDVVLIDMILSNNSKKEQEDVVGLIKELKKINNNAIYIAVTGYADHKTIKQCIEEKLVNVVQYKPVDYDVLAEYLLEPVAVNNG